MPRILLLFLTLFAFASFPILLSGCTGSSDDYYDPDAEDDPGYGGSSSSSGNMMGAGMSGAGVTPAGTQPPVQPGGYRTADGRVMGGGSGGVIPQRYASAFKRGSQAHAKGASLYQRYFRSKTDGNEVDLSMVEEALRYLETAISELEKVKISGPMKVQIEELKSDVLHMRSDLLRE